MPVAEDAYVPTRSAMLRGGRVALSVMTLLLSLGCLKSALVLHVDASVETATPVTATVAKDGPSRERRTDLFCAADLRPETERWRNIHCDVPHVEIGLPMKVGAMIKVSPRATTCWSLILSGELRWT